MYVLEHMVFGRDGIYLTYQWVPYLCCGKRKILDKVRKAQPEPRQWRVMCTALTHQQLMQYHQEPTDRKTNCAA